jgi:hypothetical protein
MSPQGRKDTDLGGAMIAMDPPAAMSTSAPPASNPARTASPRAAPGIGMIATVSSGLRTKAGAASVAVSAPAATKVRAMLGVGWALSDIAPPSARTVYFR